MLSTQSKSRTRIVRRLLATSFSDSSAKILDVGCGDGSILSPFIDNGEYVVGLDYNEEALKEAKKRGYTRTTQTDISDGLPFEDDEFSAVFAGEVIEHLIDTDAFLSECRRVLAPGGTFVVSTPNCVSLTSRFRVLVGDLPTPVHYGCESIDGQGRAGLRGHLRGFTPDILRQLVEKHGFTVDTVETDVVTVPLLTSIPWFHDYGTSLGETIIIRASA